MRFAAVLSNGYNWFMGISYSIDEAGKKFPQIIRQTRKGHSVTITCEGKAVAEILPIECDLRENLTEEEWFEYLERIGVLRGPDTPRKPIKPIATAPGALDRFLVERWGEDADQWKDIPRE